MWSYRWKLCYQKSGEGNNWKYISIPYCWNHELRGKKKAKWYQCFQTRRELLNGTGRLTDHENQPPISAPVQGHVTNAGQDSGRSSNFRRKRKAREIRADLPASYAGPDGVRMRTSLVNEGEAAMCRWREISRRYRTHQSHDFTR